MSTIKIDPLTLFIGNVESIEIVENLLSIKNQNIKGNIYVLNFSSVDLKRSGEIYNHKIKLVEMPLKNKGYIVDFIRSMDIEDGLIVLGGEKLVNYNDNISIIKKEFFNNENKMHFLESEDWISFVNDIDDIFQEVSEKISACFILITAENISFLFIIK